jgi:hypothetical protein
VAKKRTPEFQPRKFWATNLAPLVTGARQGASHAAHTARKERERARRQSQRWRYRWLYLTATGLVVAGASAGVYRAATKRHPDSPEAEKSQLEQAGGATADAVRSTVESGREKVTGAARNMLHKIRRDESDQATPTGSTAQRTRADSPNQADVTRRAAG